MQLRPNQIEPVKKGVEFFLKKKADPSIIVAPTAFGKSIVIAAIAKEVGEKLKYETLANGVIKNWNNSEWLSSQSKEYDFKWVAGGKLEVYKQVSDGRGGFDAALVQTIPNPTPETLGQYLGITTAQADNFKKSLDVARGTVNRTTNTTTKRLVSTTTKFNG